MVRARDVRRRGRIGRPVGLPTTPPTPIVDRDLSYYDEGMRWSFSGGRILLDGHDVNEMISGPNVDIRGWLGIAGGLDNYRKKILASVRQRDQLTRFEAVIEALLGKISGRVKRVYDQKTSGLNWSLEQGQLILNGMNIRSLLALYRLKKTDKARRFMQGVREKLGLLLNDPNCEKIRGTVQDLYDEISDELGGETTTRGPRPLPPHQPLDH